MNEPLLSSEQWQNAYYDLKREFDRMKEKLADEQFKAMELRLALDRASQWRQDYDTGC